MLTQLDRLVQLLESPIFTFLRMEVLNNEKKYNIRIQYLINFV